MEVSQKQLAEIFGVTNRTIRRWEQRGLPYSGQGQYKTYDTEDCIDWKVQQALEEQEPSALEKAGVPPEEVSKARERAAKAQLKEQEVRERRGELIPFSEVTELNMDVAERIRQLLLNLPGRRLKEIAAETGLATVRELRDEAVREILEELEDSFRDAADEEEAA